MSELIKIDESHDFRWRLLAEVSALALVGYVAAMPIAMAEDSDRPTVWIEVGGQLSRLKNDQEPYTPSFVDLTPSNFTSPQSFERPPRYGFDESAAVAIQPTGSDWIFSASMRYGRSSNNASKTILATPPDI